MLPHDTVIINRQSSAITDLVGVCVILNSGKNLVKSSAVSDSAGSERVTVCFYLRKINHNLGLDKAN